MLPSVELIVAFTASLAIWLTKRWHGRLTTKTGNHGHATHSKAIPRIGGLALVLGLLSACYTHPELKLLRDCLGFGLVAFSIGFIEDLAHRVSPAQRLLMCFVAGLLAAVYGGHTVNSLGIVPLDAVLHIRLVALLFTAFAIAGLCSAINMIDGKNGLASGSVAISLFGVHVIASQGGAVDLAQTALVVTWIIAGFILLNWPLGRLFMGDGGAYLIGFTLALCIIELAASGISSPWASLLIVMYPVSEVLFTVERRLRGGNPIDLPDQNHLHHLVERALISRWFGRLGKTSKNSLVAPIILPAHAACVAIAALWPTDALILFGVCIAALAAMACGLTSLRDILQKACDC